MANFDTLAGQLQSVQGRGGEMLELVATKFREALPESTKVVREWRILGGRIKEIDLHLGDVRYRIESRRPPAYTVMRQPVVHGVAVGNMEPLAPTVWVKQLCDDLARYAETQNLSTAALEKLMYG
jgi:hypothetical protein